MQLIIGGRYEDKERFARSIGVSFERCVDGRKEAQAGKADVLTHLEAFIQKSEEDTEILISRLDDLIGRNKDITFICDEIGCGIVPLDRKEQEYRVKTGKILCYLARKAERVYRVFAGIGEKIK